MRSSAHRLVIVCLVSVIALVASGVAQATVGAMFYARYSVTGFTPDGKHLYFTKKAGNIKRAGAGECDEAWLVVYSVARRRRVRSAPMFRLGKDCTKKRVSRAWGRLERKRLYKRYGAPTKGIRLSASGKGKRRRFRTKGIVVWGKVTGKYGEQEGFANFDFTVWAQRGKRNKQRLATVTINAEEDDPPALGDVVLAPDRKHLAFTVDSQPRLVKLRP